MLPTILMVDLKTEEVVPHNGFDTKFLRRVFESAGFCNISIEDFPVMEKSGASYGRWVLSAQKC